MSIVPMALVVFSAILHAGWNILGKNNRGSGMAFTLAASATAAVILTPYIIWYLLTVGWTTLPMHFWWIVSVSGVCQIIYLIGLIMAYKHSDIGVVYPVARSLPVIMVGLGSTFLGHLLDTQQWIGFTLITLGCMCVPLTSFRDVRAKSYLNLGIFWALVAAIGTTGYSILDKQALEMVSEFVRQIFSNSYTAVFYLGVQFLAISIPIFMWCLVSKKTYVIQQAWAIRKHAGLAGIMMSTTYGLVLSAMNMTANVSLVVALRQISIVFGLIMGCIFLGESWRHTRVIGVGMLMCGLILSFS
ncbi:multidrug transporter [Vibrio profundum]|uniref:multidrug transporter n=1 Tax=Vibrio profundum TaxID=2910247 RepID=UPI003D0F0645